MNAIKAVFFFIGSTIGSMVMWFFNVSPIAPITLIVSLMGMAVSSAMAVRYLELQDTSHRGPFRTFGARTDERYELPQASYPEEMKMHQ